MKAGKTEMLKSSLGIHSAMNHTVLLISNNIDQRSDIREDGILTCHNPYSSSIPDGVTQIKVKRLSDIPKKIIEEHEVIAIDEAQFFPDIILVLDWLRDYEKTFYATGLLATSEGSMFGDFYKLIPFADKVKQLKACCQACQAEIKNRHIFTPATMSKCLLPKDSEVLVGSDIYIPLCFRHWKHWDDLGLTYNSDKRCVNTPLRTSPI